MPSLIQIVIKQQLYLEYSLSSTNGELRGPYKARHNYFTSITSGAELDVPENIDKSYTIYLPQYQIF